MKGLHQSDYSKDFLQWVFTKEKEGCVFWYKPARDLQMMSHFFEEKIDPVNEQPYRPLLLDPQWWRVRFDRMNSRYVATASSVASAISHRHNFDAHGSDLDIPVLQELIYQSNPTLEPVAKWPHAPSMRYLPRSLNSSGGSRLSGDQERDDMLPRALDRHTRISIWPSTCGDRRDHLHYAWQVEEGVSSRKKALAMYGRSTLN
jgi:hypothetical protein